LSKLQLVAGTTSKTVKIFVQDSSSTTGAGLGSLAFNTSGLIAYYIKEGDASSTAISLVTATLGTWTSSGFIVVDGTHMLGLYELSIPNAALTGTKSVVIYLSGATNMVPCVLEIELTGWNNQDAVRGGMTALPNANAAASGGLPTIGATIPNATAGAANGLFIAGSNAATSIATALTSNVIGNITGNLSGSVGSVTTPVTTTYALKKNAAVAAFPFVMTDSTTHLPKSGVTVTGQVSIDGAAFTNLTNAPAGIAAGAYKVDLAAADTNGNCLIFKFTGTGSDTTLLLVITQS